MNLLSNFLAGIIIGLMSALLSNICVVMLSKETDILKWSKEYERIFKMLCWCFSALIILILILIHLLNLKNQ